MHPSQPLQGFWHLDNEFPVSLALWSSKLVVCGASHHLAGTALVLLWIDLDMEISPSLCLQYTHKITHTQVYCRLG